MDTEVAVQMVGDHGSWLGGSHALLLNASLDERRARTATWITAGLVRGEKIILTAEGGRTPDWLADHLASARRLRSLEGRIEVVDPDECRAATGGEPAALRAWHTAHIERALDAGFRGAAFTGDGTARHAVVTDPDDLLVIESDLDHLTRHPRVRALCRYDPVRESRAVLTRVLLLHYRHVDDSLWGADVVDDRLSLCGVLDVRTCPRLQQVLRAAAADGITTVDLSGVELLSAAAISVLVRIASDLERHGRALILLDPAPAARRALDAVRLTEHPGIRIETR